MLRDQVMTMLLAGHETTGAGLSWMWYLLARHPEVQERVREEAAAVLNGRPPSLEDLTRLPYARAVVEETLRLYPPAWGMTRQAIGDDELGGYHIPGGSFVFLISHRVHRHPKFWPDPERFLPERFLGQTAQGRPRFAYFPFGGGPHVCIGSGFAVMQMQIVLTTLVQRVHLSLISDRPIPPDALLSLRPGAPIHVNARQPR